MFIEFDDRHSQESTQLFIALSGNKKEMKEQLLNIIAEFDSSYGKPRQGTILGNCIVSVVTPLWEGRKY